MELGRRRSEMKSFNGSQSMDFIYGRFSPNAVQGGEPDNRERELMRVYFEMEADALAFWMMLDEVHRDIEMQTLANIIFLERSVSRLACLLQ